MERQRRSYFYKNKKYRCLEKEKKNSIILFQKFLIFPTWAFSENAQCFIGAFLERKLKVKKYAKSTKIKFRGCRLLVIKEWNKFGYHYYMKLRRNLLK